MTDALSGFDGVLALGGGALGAAHIRERLAATGVHVVWLRAAQQVLVGRIGDGGTRPLLRGRVADGLAELAAARGTGLPRGGDDDRGLRASERPASSPRTSPPACTPRRSAREPAASRDRVPTRSPRRRLSTRPGLG